MHEQAEGRIGWLAGLADRVVGSALNAMHAEPGRAWTLESLAKGANTSRSVLAERFHQLVGRTPIQYLTQWRMVLAASLLNGSNLSLGRVAAAVGYQTDTAFSRAFRREYGIPPAAWRKARAATVEVEVPPRLQWQPRLRDARLRRSKTSRKHRFQRVLTSKEQPDDSNAAIAAIRATTALDPEQTSALRDSRSESGHSSTVDCCLAG